MRTHFVTFDLHVRGCIISAGTHTHVHVHVLHMLFTCTLSMHACTHLFALIADSSLATSTGSSPSLLWHVPHVVRI